MRAVVWPFFVGINIQKPCNSKWQEYMEDFMLTLDRLFCAFSVDSVRFFLNHFHQDLLKHFGSYHCCNIVDIALWIQFDDISTHNIRI